MNQPVSPANAADAKFLIYGGAGAIGSACAALLHQRGYALHLVGRDEGTVSDIAHETSSSYTLGDVTDETLFSRAVADANAPLAGILYAVGTIQLGPLARVTPKQMREDFEINAMGAALAVQAALPALKKNHERTSIVFFSSVAATHGFQFHTSVSMAKAAVEGLTVTLAAELAPGIRVNAIAPSLTETPLAQSILANEKLAAGIADQHPLKRLGKPGDAANMAAFLLGPESDWITGQVLHVDGGRSALNAGAR